MLRDGTPEVQLLLKIQMRKTYIGRDAEGVRRVGAVSK